MARGKRWQLWENKVYFLTLLVFLCEWRLTFYCWHDGWSVTTCSTCQRARTAKLLCSFSLDLTWLYTQRKALPLPSSSFSISVSVCQVDCRLAFWLRYNSEKKLILTLPALDASLTTYFFSRGCNKQIHQGKATGPTYKLDKQCLQWESREAEEEEKCCVCSLIDAMHSA